MAGGRRGERGVQDHGKGPIVGTKEVDEVIHLTIINNVWHARFADGTEGRIRELFGTDTLPTPFRASAPALKVMRAIAKQNPGTVVTIE